LAKCVIFSGLEQVSALPELLRVLALARLVLQCLVLNRLPDLQVRFLLPASLLPL
jgi:hypothetical protein